jgi:hypothetical protein
MDKQALALLIPILVLMIPVSAIVLHGLLRITQAKAKQAPSPEMLDRLEAVEQDMAALRGQLAETQERLDFAERLLARGKEETPRHVS